MFFLLTQLINSGTKKVRFYLKIWYFCSGKIINFQRKSEGSMELLRTYGKVVLTLLALFAWSNMVLAVQEIQFKDTSDTEVWGSITDLVGTIITICLAIGLIWPVKAYAYQEKDSEKMVMGWALGAFVWSVVAYVWF